jgi:hypothetical protein
MGAGDDDARRARRTPAREARPIPGGDGTLPVGRVWRLRLYTQHQQNIESGGVVEERSPADCERAERGPARTFTCTT